MRIAKLEIDSVERVDKDGNRGYRLRASNGLDAAIQLFIEAHAIKSLYKGEQVSITDAFEEGTVLYLQLKDNMLNCVEIDS